MPTRERAKRKAAPAVIAADTAVFVTRRGVSVKLAKYNPLAEGLIEASVEAAWLEAGRPLPQKPTYTVLAAGDVEEVHEHDEKTIKGDAAATAAWAEWQAAQQRFNQDVFERQLRNFVIECMDFQIDPRWVEKAKAKLLYVPTGEFEQKLFWARAEVLSDLPEYFEMTLRSAELAGVTGPQMEVVRQTFRRALEELAGQSGRGSAGVSA